MDLQYCRDGCCHAHQRTEPGPVHKAKADVWMTEKPDSACE